MNDNYSSSSDDDETINTRKQPRRHQFKRVKDRVSSLRTELSLHSKHGSSEFYFEDESQEVFQEELQALRELWVHQDFQILAGKLYRLSSSTAQLLHHLPTIVSALTTTLSSSTTEQVATPVLRLISALARDLRGQLYPHFPELLKACTYQVDTLKPELSAEVFKSISVLLRSNTKELLSNLSAIRQNFLPILGHRSEFCREFAASTLASLLRKIKTKDRLRAYIHGLLKALVRAEEDDSSNAASDGVSRLFFEMTRNVSSRFHSRMPEIYEIILEGFNPLIMPSLDSESLSAITDIVKATSDFMKKYTTAQHVAPVWIVLQRVFEGLVSDDDQLYLSRVIDIVNIWSRFKKASLVSTEAQQWLESVVLSRIQTSVMSLELRQSSLSLIETYCTVVVVISDSDNSVLLRQLLPKVFTCGDDIEEFNMTFTSLEYLRENFDTSQSVVLLDDCIVTPFLDSCFEYFTKDTVISMIHHILTSHDDNIKLQRHLEKLLNALHNTSPCRPEFLYKLLQCIQQYDTSSLTAVKFPESILKCVTSTEKLILKSEMLKINFSMTCTMDSLIKELEVNPSSPALLSAMVHYISHHRADLDLSQEKFCTHLESCFLRNLTSSSSTVRRLTLQILSHYETLVFTNTADEKCHVVQRCLQLEEMRPSVKTEREFVRILESLGVIARSSGCPVSYIQLITAHMIGVFSIPYSTIWPHASNVLKEAAAASSPSNFDSIWNILEAEIEKQSQPPLVPEGNTSEEDVVDTLRQEWNDVVLSEKSNVGSLTERKTDDSMRQQWLWRSFEKFPTQISTKSKQVVLIFFKFLLNIYLKTFTEEREALGTNVLATLEIIVKEDGTSEVLCPTRVVRMRLVSFLSLISKFPNLRGTFQKQLVQDISFYFLIKTDGDVCRLALECLLAFKKPYLVPYRSQLLALVDDKTYRDTMISFPISRDSPDIMLEHREGLLPIITRIVYAKFLTRKGRSSKDTLAIRRAAILAFLGALQPIELTYFFNLILSPFKKDECSNSNRTVQEFIDTNLDIAAVPLSKKLGFLNMCEDVINQLGSKAIEFFSSICPILIGILQHTERESDTLPRSRELRTLCFRRFTDLVRLSKRQSENQDVNDFEFGPYLSLVWECQSAAISNLPASTIGAKEPSAFLNLIAACSTVPESCKTLKYYNIVPQVMDCLVIGCSSDNNNNDSEMLSPPITSMIFEIMDSLLTFDEENGEEENILMPYIPKLLKHFVTRLSAKANHFASGYQRIALMKTEGTILCRISKLYVSISSSNDDSVVMDNIDDQVPAQLVTLLFPFLLRNRQTSVEEKLVVLSVLSSLIHKVKDRLVHIASISTLLAPGPNALLDRKLRHELVQLFASVARNDDPVVTRTAQVLVDMHAYSRQRMEEYDFDKRLAAFSMLKETKFEEFIDHPSTALVPLLSHTMQALHDSEYTIRTVAKNALVTFFSVCKEEEKLLIVLKSTVVPGMRVGFKSQSDVIRRDFISILSTYVDTFTDSNHLPHTDLAFLRNKDDQEADIFYNIVHIQAHRRARAVQRLGAALTKHTTVLSMASLTQVLVPLLEHFVYETDPQTDQQMALEASVALGAASSLLSWSHYINLVQSLLRQVSRYQSQESLIISSVCQILDNFHFEDAPMLPSGWSSLSVLEAQGTNDDGAVNNTQRVLKTKLVPLLKTFLTKAYVEKGKAVKQQSLADLKKEDGAVTKREGKILRIPIALALVKVLRRLPVADFHAELPKLLIAIVSLLKSKDESVRVSSRETLVRIVTELGPAYLPVVVNELKHSLTDGYMVHVLSYTLHAILEPIVNRMNVKPPLELSSCTTTPSSEELSAFDSCIPSIMQVVMNDCFGFNGKFKDKNHINEYKSKTKEAKVCKSMDTMELLATGLTFLPSQSIYSLLNPLWETLGRTESLRVSTQIREMLRRVSVGLARNSSVEPSHLLFYIYSMCQTCVEENEKTTTTTTTSSSPENNNSWILSQRNLTNKVGRVKKSDTFHIEFQQKMTGYNRHEALRKTLSTRGGGGSSETTTLDVVSYGLQLLFSTVKKRKINSENHSKYVDPFVPLLLQLVSGKGTSKNEVLVGVLRVFSILLSWNVLPSIEAFKTEISSLMCHHIQHAGASSKRNEVVQYSFKCLSLLLSRNVVRLTNAQYASLITFLQSDLEEIGHQNASFGLLKAILQQKVVIEQIYDLMIRVGEKVVQSEVETVTKACRQLFLQFIIEYPLSVKRRTQHLSFLLSNLSYEFESGRKSVLRCLQMVISRFPSDLLEERVEFFFLPIAQARANNELSSDSTKLCTDVLKTLFTRLSVDKIRNVIVPFLTSWFKNPALFSLASQVAGCLVEARADSVAMSSYREWWKLVQSEWRSSIGTEEALNWQRRYASLVLVEKLVTAIPEKIKSITDSSILITELMSLMLFPHSWVRLVTNRVLAKYLEVVGSSEVLKQHVFNLMANYCTQLESKHLSSELANGILNGLLFAVSFYKSNPQLLLNEEESTDIEEDGDKKKQNGIDWLYTRVSYIARDASSSLRQMTVFKFFAAMITCEASSNSSQIGHFEKYLVHMLNPLYRCVTSEVMSSEVKTMAAEVVALLELRCSDQKVYMEAYAFVKAKVTTFRNTRKEQRKIEAVADPERFAKRKMRKNENKKLSMRKRKLQTLMKHGKVKKRRPVNVKKAGEE